jgi:hypothetical protein
MSVGMCRELRSCVLDQLIRFSNRAFGLRQAHMFSIH